LKQSRIFRAGKKDTVIKKGYWLPEGCLPVLWLFFGIHFPGDVPGNAVPDTLASDNSGLFQLQLILFEVLAKVLPLPGHKGSSEGFNVRRFDSHIRYFQIHFFKGVRRDNAMVWDNCRTPASPALQRCFFVPQGQDFSKKRFNT
jgi:hypothetical protein